MDYEQSFLKVFKPWENPKNNLYPQAKQILIISSLLAIWVHVIFFGIWQISGKKMPLAIVKQFDLPNLEITFSAAEFMDFIEVNDESVYNEKNYKPLEHKLPALHTDLEKEADILEDLKALTETFEKSPEKTQDPLNTASFDVLAEIPPKAKNKYTTMVKSKIYKHWVRPPDVGYQKEAMVEIWVTIDPNGILTKIEIRNSFGDEIANHAALEAVKASSPFEPFPKEMYKLKSFTYGMKFYYY